MRNILAKLRRGFGIAKTYQLRHSLGAGGFGLTGVVDQYDDNGRHEKVLAIKYKLSQRESLRHEKQMTQVSGPSAAERGIPPRPSRYRH